MGGGMESWGSSVYCLSQQPWSRLVIWVKGHKSQHFTLYPLHEQVFYYVVYLQSRVNAPTLYVKVISDDGGKQLRWWQIQNLMPSPR